MAQFQSAVAEQPFRFFMGIIILMKLVLMKIIFCSFRYKENIFVRPMSRKVTVMNEVNNFASVYFGKNYHFALDLGISSVVVNLLSSMGRKLLCAFGH